MIPVRNVYYMLAYAFRVLPEAGYRAVQVEHFDNLADMSAAILIRGVERQLKQGLGRNYLPTTEELPTIRGKVEVRDSIRRNSAQRQRVICSFDEFSEDTGMNRIVKAAIQKLLVMDVPAARKKQLRSLLPHFSQVREVDLRRVRWDHFYNHNNRGYRMMLGICWLLSQGKIQSTTDGADKVMDFAIDPAGAHSLFEKFILEYFRKEHPELWAHAPYIPWAVDGNAGSALLPTMKTDIVLRSAHNTLVIDAKYYGSNLREHFGKRSLVSENLYQVFTYVKNEQANLSRSGKKDAVAGMLLYARTESDQQPDEHIALAGSDFYVRTLDLSQEFGAIAQQLDDIPRVLP